VWSKVLEALIAMGYSTGKLRLDKVAVDSTTLSSIKSSMERFFAWLTNGFRRLAIRWERLASTFTAFIQLACIIIYLRVFR